MASVLQEGFMRDDVTGALVTVDVAVAVAPLSIQDGFLRDANYALVTTAAPSTPAVQEGFQRETAAGAHFYALVAGGATATTQFGVPRDANYALATS